MSRKLFLLLSLVLVVTMGWGTAATAGTLLQYIDTGANCYQVGPCTQAPGVSGSNLATVSGNGYSGYTNLPWSSYGLGFPQAFDFTMTAASYGQITGFGLDAFNNDCEINGWVFCNSPVNWTVQYNVNGGAYTPFLTFNSGTPYVTYAESAALNQAFNPGDHITFLMYTWDSAVISTGQYVFTNIEVNGTTVPEPGSLLLLGSGLVGIAGVARRRLVR